MNPYRNMDPNTDTSSSKLKLYQSNRCFIISFPSVTTMIVYNDDGLGESSVSDEDDQSKILIAESDHYVIPYRYHHDADSLTYCTFNGQPLKFSYDEVNRELLCDFNDNGPKVLRMKCETTIQLWMDAHHGPYSKFYLDYDDRFSQLDYVYQYTEIFGRFVDYPVNVESNCIIVPNNRFDEFKEFGRQLGLDIKIENASSLI